MVNTDYANKEGGRRFSKFTHTPHSPFTKKGEL